MREACATRAFVPAVAITTVTGTAVLTRFAARHHSPPLLLLRLFSLLRLSLNLLPTHHPNVVAAISVMAFEVVSSVAEGKKIERIYLPRESKDCPTLKDFLDFSEIRNEDGETVDVVHAEWKMDPDSPRYFVICITGHWIVVHGGKWVCSMNHNPRGVDDCPYLYSRVRHVIWFDDYNTSG